MQWVYRLGLGGAPVPHGSAPVGALHREPIYTNGSAPSGALPLVYLVTKKLLHADAINQSKLDSHCLTSYFCQAVTVLQRKASKQQIGLPISASN